MATIRMKRGIQSDIEAMPLLSGEMAVALDTGRVFVGTEEGTVPLGTGDMYAAIYDPTKKEQDIFAYAVPAAEKGVAGGVATLDESGKIPKAFLPEYSGGGTATGKKTVRFVIGTATAGWTEADCDYLCDGIDDQVEINAAIQALPDTGGTIRLLEGMYNITESIMVNKEFVKFSGNGSATVLKRMWKGSHGDGVIVLSVGNCTFSNFAIDGNNTIFESGSGLHVSQQNLEGILISNLICNNNYEGINLDYVRNSTLSENMCSNNTLHGIRMENTQNIIVVNNVCYRNRHCGISAIVTQTSIINGNTCCDNTENGIDCGSANGTTCIGNVCNNNKKGIDFNCTEDSVCTGNICNNNSSSGVYLNGAENDIITDNSCKDNGSYGLFINGAKKIVAIGNMCHRGTGTSSDYTSSQHTVYMSSYSDGCIVVGNHCLGKAPTTAGSGHIIDNNKS